MMAALIAEVAGIQVADKTAMIMRYERHAQASDSSWTIGRLGTITLNPQLKAAVQCMNSNIESSL